VLAETRGRLLEARLMRQRRKIGDLSEDGFALLLLALDALGLLAGTLFVLTNAFIIALLLALAFTSIGSLFLLGAGLDPPLLGLLGARFLLVVLDDGLDHLPECGDLDAVLLGDVGQIEHPLDNGQT